MGPTRLISEFKPHETGFKKVLGDLETEIMEVIWQREHSTVRDVYEELLQKRRIAYTTVLTIMRRLFQKGLLTQFTRGQAFVYIPVESKRDFEKRIVAEVLDGLLSEFEELTINYLKTQFK